MGARLTAWLGELGHSRRSRGPGHKPDFDSFVVPALVQQNKEAATDYFNAVGALAAALAVQAPGASTTEIAETVAAKKAIMVSTNTKREFTRKVRIR